MKPIEALVLLFGNPRTVTEEIVNVVGETLYDGQIPRDLKKDLKSRFSDVFQKLSDFLADPDAYFGQEGVSGVEEELLNRLLNRNVKPAPEADVSPKPADIPAPKQKSSSAALASAVARLAAGKSPAPSASAQKEKSSERAPQQEPAPKEQTKMDPRQTALRCLFGEKSARFAEADLTAIGSRYRVEKKDVGVLSDSVCDSMERFAGAPQGYIDGIVRLSDAWQNFTDEQIEAFRQKLQNLLAIQKTAEPAPIVTLRTSDEFSEMPMWIKRLHQNPICTKTREIIESAFQLSRDPNPAKCDEGMTRFAMCKQRMQQFAQGCFGPDLVNLGRHMENCIKDLEMGVDPSDPQYIHHYINS